jgi:dienelactone hydrolase
MADPRWPDATIDPNDRRIGWCFLGEPRAANLAPAGVARYSTLRAWLSQWSIDDTQARAHHTITRVRAPLLAIENSADDAVPQPHVRLVFDASPATDKHLEVIEGANHCYAGQPEHLADAVGRTLRWLRDNNLSD